MMILHKDPGSAGVKLLVLQFVCIICGCEGHSPE